MKKVSKIIQVAGDAAVDILRFPRSVQSGANLPAWKRLPGYSETKERGGALLLADLIQAALPNCTVVSDRQECTTLISRMTLFGFDGIWRAALMEGFDEQRCDKPALTPVSDGSVPDTLVLFDSDNGFNQTKSRWPVSLSNGTFSGPLFLRLCRPLADSPLIRQIKKLQKTNGVRVTAVVDASDLRADGASISRGLSWERTLIDFCTEMFKKDGVHPLLSRFDFLVVRLGGEGAIAVDCKTTRENLNNKKLLVSGSLLFDNNMGEGDLDRSFPGTMAGGTSVFMAGLIRCAGSDISLETLRNGIRCGLSATRDYLIKLGFGKSDTIPAYPVAQVGDLLLTASGGERYSEAELIELSDADPCTPEARFSILEKQVPDTLTALAKLVVRNGNTKFTNVPKGKFGHLLTVEQTEIENYRKIQSLMLEYLAVPASERPLCFAVFGPPGSGKSFGVKQIAKQMGMKPVTFNLSEFGSPDELIRAFHLVRDITLKGETPLIFFDEFDSGKDGLPLFWLKYFLAPMQDGEFRDGEAIHPIGKAIFVFAGGTCASYEQFSNRTGNEFKDVKGPDFVSRLRGYLNVMGPDPVHPDDFGYIIRRALLLRNFLEARAKKLGARKHELIDPKGNLEIDDGLLTAFLQVPKYRHGVRSMQSVIDMSAIDQGRGYRKSELPAFDQLDMHVDAETFIYLVHRDEQFEPHIRTIAPLIHKGYLDDLEKKIPGKPSHQPWSKLPPVIKESNEEQARDIPAKLSLFNIRIEKDRGQQPAEFTEKEILYLSQVEHRRWMRKEKETPTVPVHPCMVHWEKLSEEEQQKDINAVKRIPEHLKACGLVMVR